MMNPRTLLRVIINQLNSENDHENWDEIASFFEPAISVVRNPKSDKSRWNVLKREKVKSHWEKLDNHVQVKLRYILEYGDGRILIDKGAGQFSVDLNFLKETMRIFFKQETGDLLRMIYVLVSEKVNSTI